MVIKGPGRYQTRNNRVVEIMGMDVAQTFSGVSPIWTGIIFMADGRTEDSRATWTVDGQHISPMGGAASPYTIVHILEEFQPQAQWIGDDLLEKSAGGGAETPINFPLVSVPPQLERPSGVNGYPTVKGRLGAKAEIRQVTFSLCHTTARLPNGWRKAFDVWLERCDDPSQVEYVLTVDKARMKELPVLTWREYLAWRSLTIAPNYARRCAVDGWNTAGRASSGKVLITVSDDWFPPEHWDTLMLKYIPDLDGDYVLDVDNSDNSSPLLPFSILTRKYYERLGYFFYPEFIGMMADNDFTDVARGDGVVVNARKMVFEHLHPEHGTAPMDDTYAWQHRPEAWDVGNSVYNRRVRERKMQAVLEQSAQHNSRFGVGTNAAMSVSPPKSGSRSTRKSGD